jgi:hypothetical protein
LAGNLANDSDDETKITSLSLDELNQQAASGGVFLPPNPIKKMSSNASADGSRVGSSDTSQVPAVELPDAPPLPSASSQQPERVPSPKVQSAIQATHEEKDEKRYEAVPPPPKALGLKAPDLKAAEVRAVTHLGLVKIVCRILRRPLEKVELLSKACDILEHALSDASAFDDNHPLRIELSRRGFVKEGSERPQKEGIIKPLIPPDALEVEVLSASTLLKYMQSQVPRDEQRFERVLVGLVNRYLRQDRILAAEQTFKPKSSSAPGLQTVGTTKSESEKELLALTPVVLFALRGMLETEGSPVDRALPWIFPLLLQLIECPNRDVRAIVRRILEKHVTHRLNFKSG